MTSSETTDRERRRIQFSLRTAFLLVTVCAFATWITNAFGFIPILGALGGTSLGAIAGMAVGLPFGSSRRSAWVGGISGPIVIGIAIVWLFCILAGDLLSRGQKFPVVIPLVLLMRDWFHLTGVALALAAAVPTASIAAVNKRYDHLVVLWPAFTSGCFAFLGGLLFFAFDVWCRGGFPQPPLPWPIALAIPLIAGTFAAAVFGFACGLVWLAIRALFRIKTQ